MRTFLTFVFSALLFSAAIPAQGALIFGVTSGNNLISFDTATPGAIGTSIAINAAGDAIQGIDFRPADGTLYGLGSSSRLYTINTTTGVATPVAGAFVPALSGTAFGFDFNPTVDRIRVTSDTGQNLRLIPANGTPTAGTVAAVDTNLTYTPGDPNAGAAPNIVGSAYTNSFLGSVPATTALYGIDSRLGILALQTNPNGGVLQTRGSLGVATSNQVGFDILAANNVAFASLTNLASGISSLYTVNLATGAASLVGGIGSNLTIRDIAIVQPAVPEPATIGLVAVSLLALGFYRRRKV